MAIYNPGGYDWERSPEDPARWATTEVSTIDESEQPAVRIWRAGNSIWAKAAGEEWARRFPSVQIAREVYDTGRIDLLQAGLISVCRTAPLPALEPPQACPA